MNERKNSETGDSSLERKFDELRESFERSEADFERCLNDMGLSREILSHVSERVDLLRSPNHRRVFERYRNMIDDEISSLKTALRGNGGSFFLQGKWGSLIRV